MNERAATADGLPIVTLGIRNEADIVLVRQRTRLVADLLGFSAVDQTRVATAVSEIARNALRHGGGGRARLFLTRAPQALTILVEDRGPGFHSDEEISEPAPDRPQGGGRGVFLSRRLMDDFVVGDRSTGGTAVRLSKRLPLDAETLGHPQVAALVDELLRRPPESLLEELHQQHQELLAVLEGLTARQEELRASNAELEETNRGVMALYADVTRELDDTNRGVMALYSQLDDQATELRRLNALKDRFLSHLSHEFRTPLNAALALSRLLLDRVDGPLTSEQAVQVGFIHDGAAELLEMVNDLLDLAKIEAGRLEAHTERVELSELVGEFRGMFRPLASAAGLELWIEPPPSSLSVIWTDRGMLAQILRNLLSNAVKYAGRGEVRLTTTVDGDSVVFSVSDTGVGIPPGELEGIFEDFVQGSRRRSPGTQGTGLGLPLARELSELLGGTIQAESRVDHGSTFRVRIPVGEPPAPEAAAPPDASDVRVADASPAPPAVSLDSVSPRAQGGAHRVVTEGASVLVVDQNASTRYLLAHMLASGGFTVAHARTAPEALEQARHVELSGVFLDLGLPHRAGLHLLERLRREPSTAEVPIIVYTSRELDEEDARAFTGLKLHWVRESEPHLAKSIGGLGDAFVHSVAHTHPENDP